MSLDFMQLTNLIPRLFTRHSALANSLEEGPGSSWSRGHLNYFVLGEGWSKENRLIRLISVFEISIHSPAMLKSSKQCFCNSVYSNVILRDKLFLGCSVATVQFSYWLCKVVNFPSVASVVFPKKVQSVQIILKLFFSNTFCHRCKLNVEVLTSTEP